MDTVQTLELIATNEKVRRGRPYIRGTSVTVADVAIVKLYHRQDADGLAAWFDLTLPQVYAALAHYYAHKEEMDAEIREKIREAEALKEKRVGSRDSLLS